MQMIVSKIKLNKQLIILNLQLIFFN